MNPVLSPILRRALAKDPADRYQKVAELVADIRKLLRETVGGPRILLRGWPLVVGIILIVAMVLTGIWLFTRPPEVGLPMKSPIKISVLLADFQNKTGDPVFDGVLETTLGLSLDNASFISIYDTKQARRQAIQLKPSSEGRLDLELAQLISRSQGIYAVINATIEPSNGGFLIKVWAVDPSSSQTIGEVEQKISSKQDVFKAADVLSAKLQAELIDIPPDTTETLMKETFTTTSLEAMKAYADAQELDALGKQEEAIKGYLRALDNDPNFGRAYSGLAVIYYNRGRPQEAERYYQEALKRIDQMNEREKHRTRGGYYLFKLNSKGAIEEYNSLVEQYPGDAAGHSMLAFAYFLDHNMMRAYEEGSHALELNPHHIYTRYNLSWFALAAGELERARQEAHTLVEQNPSFEEAYLVRALSELAQGQSAQAAKTYHQLESVSPLGASLTSTGLADLALYEGRLGDAIDILNKGIASDIKNNYSDRAAYKYNMLAHIYLLQDKKNLALESAQKAVSSSKRGEVLFEAAQVHVLIGQNDDARSLAAELSKKVEPENQAYAKLIGGEMSMARDDPAGALNLFREAQAIVDTWLGHFALGRAYLDAEAYTEAYSEFETCLKRSGETTSIFLNDLPSFHYFSSVYYYLGRAQEGLGSDAATDSYQKFLKIKEKADEGDALVEDARRRLNEL
ncbi:Beta-barrel assembly-enhancing protease [subsurface metagenome]